jgi:hypothetical protein
VLCYPINREHMLSVLTRIGWITHDLRAVGRFSESLSDLRYGASGKHSLDSKLPRRRLHHRPALMNAAIGEGLGRVPDQLCKRRHHQVWDHAHGLDRIVESPCGYSVARLMVCQCALVGSNNGNVT